MNSVISSPSIFESAPSTSLPTSPAWLKSLNASAWGDFQSLPMPGRKLESWRFADLTQLEFSNFVGGTPAPASVEQCIRESTGLKTSAGRIIFVNDTLVHTDAGLMQLGITVSSLENVEEDIRKTVTEAHTPMGSDKFVALHQAQLKAAAVIVVPEKIELSAPLEIFHWAVGAGQSVFPRTILVVRRHAKVSVLEHHRSLDTDAHFSCGMTQLMAAEGGNISYVLSQQRSLQSKSVHFTSTRCAKDAQILHCQLNLGSSWTRHECVSHLDGPGSRSDMLGVSLTDGTQEADNRTLQLHHAPHAQSDLLYKNVLFGKSRNIFAGLIVVDDGAHFTDAYQTCRNLLMTNDCEANAMPGLEINADQVKCSHGSTSGAIDPEEIFYLRSRGISESAARALLAHGFLAQTLERLTDEGLREYLLDVVAERFLAAMNA